MHVIRSERLLGFGGFADRLVEIAAGRVAAVENAGFVEMNMRLNKAGRNQAAAQIEAVALGWNVWSNRRDPAVLDADIRGVLLASKKARIPQNEIHFP
jgi:hypothetical protein